jgi:hypothetical protein
MSKMVTVDAFATNDVQVRERGDPRARESDTMDLRRIQGDECP